MFFRNPQGKRPQWVPRYYNVYLSHGDFGRHVCELFSTQDNRIYACDVKNSFDRHCRIKTIWMKGEHHD